MQHLIHVKKKMVEEILSKVQYWMAADMLPSKMRLNVGHCVLQAVIHILL